MDTSKPWNIFFENYKMNSQEEDLARLLDSVPGLNFNGFASNFTWKHPPVERWKQIADLNLAASDTMDCNASAEDLINWLQDKITSSIISKQVLLSIGGHGNLPWAAVEISDARQLASTLWLNSESRELIIADPASGVILGVTSEEYTYETRILSL